jgi:hypothetical protein
VQRGAIAHLNAVSFSSLSLLFKKNEAVPYSTLTAFRSSSIVPFAFVYAEILPSQPGPLTLKKQHTTQRSLKQPINAVDANLSVLDPFLGYLLRRQPDSTM